MQPVEAEGAGDCVVAATAKAEIRRRRFPVQRISLPVMGYNAELQLLLPEHRGKNFCWEWTGSLCGGGGVSGVAVGWAADAASGGACHNWIPEKKGRGSEN